MTKQTKEQELEKDDIIFSKETVDYFKNRNIKDADRLLMRTARNNFQEGIKLGKAQEQERILKICKKAKQKDPTEVLAISMLVYNQLIDRLIISKIKEIK